MFIREEVCGNIFARIHEMEAGEVIDGHTHNFPHLSLVFTGAVRVEAVLPDGTLIDRVYKAPDYVTIRKDVRHKITALEQSKFWCMFSHRDPRTGEVVQEYNGYHGAYG